MDIPFKCKIPVPGGPDEAVRQPEERGHRHQEPQVVRTDGVDRRLPEEVEQKNPLRMRGSLHPPPPSEPRFLVSRKIRTFLVRFQLLMYVYGIFC